MFFMRRLLSVILSLSAASASASPPPQCSELANRLDTWLSTRQVTVSNARWNWKELQDFHAFFLEAMALDPANVPTEETPDALLPENLNVRVKQGVDSLIRARHVAEKFGLEKDLDEYVALTIELLDQRQAGLYTRARRIVKRGALHAIYTRLASKLQERGPQHMELKVAWDQEAGAELVGEMRNLASAFKGGTRGPASLVESEETQVKWIRSLFWVLIPLVFVTGLSAGLLWNRRGSGKDSDWVNENSEPRL
jgi:hypothetical protein